MFFIYMHRNKINKKVYIGITSREPHVRWGKNGNNYNRHKHFYSAIKKYGWDNFEHKILTTVESKEEAEKIEKILIKRFKSTDRVFGYNIRNFSNTKTPYIIYEYDSESGRFIRLWKNCQCIKDELGVNESIIYSCCNNKSKTASGHYFTYENYGEKLPDEILINIQNKHHVNVAQYDLNGNFLNAFESIQKASEYLGTGRPTIENRVSYGYIWKKIDMFKDESYKEKLSIDELKYCLKEITGQLKCCKYSTEGDFIKTYNNAIEAAKEINGSYFEILKSCRKDIDYAYGYIWRFAYEVEPYVNLDKNDPSIIAYQNKNKTIHQYDKNGKYIKSFRSSGDAERNTGILRSTIKGYAFRKGVVTEDFLWRYEKEGYKKNENIPYEELYKNNVFVIQYNLNNEPIKVFKGINEASKDTSISRECIRDCCNQKQKTSHGYIWKKITPSEYKKQYLDKNINLNNKIMV